MNKSIFDIHGSKDQSVSIIKHGLGDLIFTDFTLKIKDQNGVFIQA